MAATDLQRIANFRVSFARRQAAVVTAVPGGVVVLDPRYPASHEHNQLVIGGATVPAGLPPWPTRPSGTCLTAGSPSSTTPPGRPPGRRSPRPTTFTTPKSS